jgi:hypothetical protein
MMRAHITCKLCITRNDPVVSLSLLSFTTIKSDFDFISFAGSTPG